MGFFRFAAGVPFAVIVTSLIFVLMYHLIRVELVEPTQPEDRPVITIRRTTTETDPVRPDRLEIELPEPPDTPQVEFETDITGATDDPVGERGNRRPRGDDPGPIVIPDAMFPVQQVAPQYPSDCATRGEEGTATVQFDITNSGRIANIEIVSESHRCFGRAAARAIANWRYSPLDGADPNAIRLRGEKVTFEFDLEGEE